MSPQQTTTGSLLQGGATTTQLQPTSTLSVMQPAATGQMLQPAGPTGVAPTPMQSAPVMPAGPSPEEIAAQQQAAQRSSLQKGIQKLVGDAMGVYDTLYGNLNTAAASQRQALESRFAKETGALGEQFTQEIPRIGQAYAARGAYDSSFRGRAEQRAREGFEKQLQGLGDERFAAMAKIGEDVATREAEFRGGQESLNQYLARIPNTTDITELTNLQTELQNRINQLRTAGAGLQSQEAFVQRFQQLAPASDRTAQLQATLSRIIAGEAPGALKQSVGAQIIASSNLTDEEKAQVLAQFNAQVVQPPVTQTV